MDADRIEKQIVVKAQRTKVWLALADASQFGEWFGVKVDGDFAPGARVWAFSPPPDRGEGLFEIQVEEMLPEQRFGWRWRAGPPARVAEEWTQVLFELRDGAEGTLLSVAESGFEALSAEKRGIAYNSNEQGWTVQLAAVARYLEKPGEGT